MTTTDIKNRTISDTTAGFIGMRESLSGLYDTALRNLMEIYDEETALEVLEAHFMREYKALETSIDRLIIRSISNNLSEVGNCSI